MIFWMILIPGLCLVFILYFQYFDLLYKGKKGRFRINIDQLNLPGKWEYRNSIINLFVYSGLGLLLDYLVKTNQTKIVFGSISGMNIFLWQMVLFFLALGVHDLYFYTTHRILHIRFLYNQIHSWHHRSQNTNSWTTFSFHPVEGVIQGGVIILIALLLPLHFYTFAAFVIFMLFMSVYGHSGYELRPNKLKIFNIFNNSIHHYQHHQLGRYNFGIYLNIWDRLFNSNSPTYQEETKVFNDRFSRDK